MSVSRTSPRRFARRVRVRKWSRIRILTLALLVAVVAVGGAWVVLGSSAFGVSSVTVLGASRVDADQVERTADVVEGTPLARVDTAAVARRVGRLPAVRTVVVSRRWPRGLAIEVTERQAVAVRREGEGYVLVDRTGVVFADAAARPKGLPLVTAPLGSARLDSPHHDRGPAALRSALDALADVPEAVRGQVVEVRAATPDQVQLLLTRRRTVVWGSPERGQRKGRVLGVLLTRRAAVYDVSAPDVPTTRTQP